MGVLALTYALEVQENGTKRLRDAPGQVGYYQSIDISLTLLSGSWKEASFIR